MMKKLAVGLSGGVDSSAAARILLERGYDVMGIILRLKPLDGADSDISDAEKIAKKLGIELRVVDKREFFKKSVIEPFVGEYLSARTPNPCVECNYALKFGAMLEYALENGCDGIATGHYAGAEKCGNRILLKKSISAKDQSYFLYRLNQFQLSHSVFPLEGLEKSFIRQKAEECGIHVAEKKDSQEICFVPDDDYIAYLSSLGVTSPKGNFIDKEGNILGTHNGIINYTIGQRKGLGAFGKPMFVTGISAENNTVTIGENGSQYRSSLVADRVNWIAFDKVDSPIQVQAKIRFKAKEQPATVTPNPDGTVTVEFTEPQRSVTPGQSVVFYDGDIVLGGGRIIK